MTEFVLVLMLFAGANSGVAIKEISVRFDTLEQCEKAGARLKLSQSARVPSSTYMGVACIEVPAFQ